MALLSVAIGCPPTNAGFDPVPQKVNRHPVSQPEFGKPTPQPEHNQPQTEQQVSTPQNQLTDQLPKFAPLQPVGQLVNQPEYEAKVTTIDLDASQIGNWLSIQVDDKPCRVAPTIVAEKSFEINLNELTIEFEGQGSLQARIAYYHKDNLQEAIEKKNITSFKKINSGTTTLFTSNHKGAGYAWIILQAQGKIKLTALKHSCNQVKDGLYGHIAREYRFASGSLQYRIMYPHNYDPTKKYPLVIGVHGSGGVGHDNRKNMEMTNLARFLYTSYYHEPQFECFSIVPQIPDDKSIPSPYFPNGNIGLHERIYHPVVNLSAVNSTGWYTQATVSLVKDMLASSELSIDPARVYFAGFSYGGKACWEFLKAEPDLFAAAISCAGWPIGIPYQAPTQVQLEQMQKEVAGYKNVPTYIAVGENDGMKLGSKAVYDEIVKQDGTSFYKEWPKTDHVGSAIKTWSDPATVQWLFGQRKGK